MPIFAQAAAVAAPVVERGHFWEWFVAATVFGGFVIALVSIVLGIRHARRERELEHLERMKALETGQLLPGDAPWWTPAKAAVAIGGVVPALIVLATLSASVASGRIAHEVWLAVGAIGVGAVAGGTILGLRLPEARRPAGGHPNGYAKPIVDADHFDVVGRRG